jgi:hypothetical protein
MKGLFATAYFGPVSYYQKLNECSERTLDIHEYLVKQSYRNRTVIYGANGPLNLIIPLEKRKNKSVVKDLKIFNDPHWKQLHQKSLDSAYRSSPFYEFYEDDLNAIFEKKYDFLLDFNNACHEFIADQIQIELPFIPTNEYVSNFEGTDYRTLIHPKKDTLSKEEEYYQVFEEKYGFLKDLSILDLLFSQGPNTISYL